MFINRVVKEWNILNKHVVSANNVNIFKESLDMDEENGW